MARVDFHSQVGDKLAYCCRLVRKILASSPEGDSLRRVVILGDDALLNKLDQMLWNFSAEDFLPHCFADSEQAPITPIVLASQWDDELFATLPHADVLIHLGQEFMPNVETLAERFPRLIEVVSLEEKDLLAGRERYKQYRTMGHELHNHDQKGA